MHKSEALSLELIQVVEEIQFYQKQIEFLDIKLKAPVAIMQNPLFTIPYTGFRLAAIILSEIDDIKRIKSPDQLLAFDGMTSSI